MKKKGIRKANKAPPYVKGFQLFDKVRLDGGDCSVFSRRQSGYFDVRRLDGTRVSPWVHYKKLSLVEPASTLLIERREGDSSHDESHGFPRQLFMKDSQNRTIDYLRISVTDRCNMRCLYCMPEEGIPTVPSEEILTYEEILFIVEAGLLLGINKIRVTGGEPLVRKGLLSFIEQLSAFSLKDLSMTTNGLLLPLMAGDLMDVGLKRLNISLDTLKRERFHRLTRIDGLKNVWQGIERSLYLGFSPVKLNVVILKGFNEDEVNSFAQLTLEYPLEVRFIEWMPLGCEEEGEHYVSNERIKERIEESQVLLPVQSNGSGPAEIYTLPHAKGKIGFISPLSCNFCQYCNRLRLTSEGRIRPCLARDKEYDLKALIRGGASLLDVKEELKEILKNKPDGHRFYTTPVTKSMYKIGG